MLIHELVRLQKSVDIKNERQRHRLSARQLRAQLREQRRAEQLLAEMRVSRLC
ncbi:hypothetical protein [Actinorugispora endophytica]|uniref:Uncharacterized protein n=1 Tax=Actinorugispora endophytica TaxID=1605990 RepID=A0A4R6V6L0_9ACTN|nr:hypothetical protein [Actinorugispora endophytica]TDQ54716.1 hypothetical protein EV190_10132 [Actinorugispora endophytica]